MIWMCGLPQLMAWLKEHPLARPIFKAFVVVVREAVCNMTAAPSLGRAGTRRAVAIVLAPGTDASALPAGAGIAEACRTAEVLPAFARLDKAAGKRRRLRRERKRS